MTAHEMVAKIRNLPPVSHAALRLISLLDRPESSNEEVVQVLKNDSALTAKLLRACNSPAMGLAEPVTSVDQAVFILGHRQILQMVTALAFSGPMSISLPGYAIEASELWRHSLIAASAAQVTMADRTQFVVESSTAFTVGLLHDIGKLVMAQFLTNENQTAIRRRIGEGLSSAEAERDVLGTDHAEVGASLLYLWRLPDNIVEAVANHHQPVLEPEPRLSVVAHVANCIAHIAGGSPGWESYALKVNPKAVSLLELQAEELDRITVNVRDSFAQVDQFMSMR